MNDANEEPDLTQATRADLSGTRGRYVRFFAAVVVIVFAVALTWGAVVLVSSIHRG